MEPTRENLEAVVTTIANKIRKQECFKFSESDFVIILSEELTNSALIKSGNPVTIVIRMSELVNAIQTKNSREFNGLLESCLRNVPRMLHTLAIVPIADVLARNDELKKWKRATFGDTDKFMPRMLPANEVYYDIQTVVTAYHTRTDTTVRVKAHGRVETLKEEAHRMLSGAVRDNLSNPKE